MPLSHSILHIRAVASERALGFPSTGVKRKQALRVLLRGEKLLKSGEALEPQASVVVGNQFFRGGHQVHALDLQALVEEIPDQVTITVFLADPGGIVALRQQHVVGEVTVRPLELVRVPVVDLDVLPDGADEIVPVAQPDQAGHLQVVVAHRVEYRGLKLEAIWGGLLEDGDATSPDDRPVRNARRYHQAAFPIVLEEAGVAEAHPVAAFVERRFVVRALCFQRKAPWFTLRQS